MIALQSDSVGLLLLASLSAKFYVSVSTNDLAWKNLFHSPCSQLVASKRYFPNTTANEGHSPIVWKWRWLFYQWMEPVVKEVPALYTWSAEEEGEVSFSDEDMVEIVKIDDDTGWYTVRNKYGEVGLAPCCYLNSFG